MRTIPASELLINPDGTIFHLHLLPEQVADRVVLVGDPGRVDVVAGCFDTIECRAENREFRTATGRVYGKRVTCLSTGIGCGNIDIVMNELDALHNIDLAARQARTDGLRRLRIVRIGTCGGLQPSTPEGSYVASQASIGLDGILNYYARRNEVCDLDMEQAFTAYMQWGNACCTPLPYAVRASEKLLEAIAAPDLFHRGVTLTVPGFYGPQCRNLRLPLADPEMESKVRTFRFGEMKILNFEMESSLVAGLAALLGHDALTVCLVIANRYAQSAQTDYKEALPSLIDAVLARI